MRVFWIGLTYVAIGFITAAGCGRSEDGVFEEVSDGIVEVASDEDAFAEVSPAEAVAGEDSTGDSWKTVTTLRSNDPPWQDTDNIRVSPPFTATGEVRLVLEMPDAEKTDGAIGVIIPADKATDLRTLLGAIRDGVSVVMVAASPVEVVSGLDGTYVFVNAVPAAKAWSLDLQVQP